MPDPGLSPLQVDTLCLEDLQAFIAQALCLQGKSTAQLINLQVMHPKDSCSVVQGWGLPIVLVPRQEPLWAGGFTASNALQGTKGLLYNMLQMAWELVVVVLLLCSVFRSECLPHAGLCQ